MVTASFEVVWGYQICEFFSSKNQSKKSRNFIILSGFFLQFFFQKFDMVVLQKSENQVYADIVRSLKQNFRSEPTQPSPPRSERKVLIRTNRHYRSELTDDHWKDRYNRHVKQSVCGFYTPAHVPYASVGEVCLDMRDLVISTVGFDQSSEKVIHNSLYFNTINCQIFPGLVMKNVHLV